MGDDPYEIRTARDAPVPPKLLRFRPQPLHGQTAMQLPDTKTTQHLGVVSSHLADSAGIAKLRHAGWEGPAWPFGEQKGGDPEAHSGHMVFCVCHFWTLGGTLRMAFLLMRDEVRVMNGRPFVWQLGAVNLWGRRRLGVRSDNLCAVCQCATVVARSGE